MHRYIWPLLAGFAATAFLAIGVTTASARNLEITNGNWRITWAELEFNNTAGTIGVVRCRFTMEGSFHARTFPKVSRSLIGLVTSAIVDGANCTGGTSSSVTVRRETLPWHLQFSKFEGRLPRIELILALLVGASFAITSSGITCFATMSALEPGGLNFLILNSSVFSVLADRTRQIALTGGGLCSLARGFLEGTGTPTAQNSATRISINLI